MTCCQCNIASSLRGDDFGLGVNSKFSHTYIKQINTKKTTTIYMTVKTHEATTKIKTPQRHNRQETLKSVPGQRAETTINSDVHCIFVLKITTMLRLTCQTIHTCIHALTCYYPVRRLATAQTSGANGFVQLSRKRK